MKLLFALLGVALAAQTHEPLGRPLSPQSEYTFRYDGAISSGLPVESEAAVTRLQSDVVVQITSDRSAILQLRNTQIAASNIFVGDKMVPFESLRKRVIPADQLKLIELPVRFQYKDGLVSEIQFAEHEHPWSANIKRSVLNMLQINLKKNGIKETEESDLYFSLVEQTIEGECEVVYSVEKETQTITKVIDFTKCSRTLDIGYGMRFTKDLEKIKTLVPQTSFTYKMEEEKLKEVTVRSTYTVYLKDESVMKTEVQSRLALIDVNEISSEIEAPTGKKEQLLYTNEWERNVEMFFKNGETKGVNPFADFTSKVDRAAYIVKTITDFKENDPEVVHEMARLVRVFRMSSTEELDKIHDQIFDTATQPVKDIIHHALAIAGTKSSIEHLIRHIQDKDIGVVKASELLKSIQETAYESEKIADLVLELAQSEICRDEPILRQSAWLAFGSVVRGIVAPSSERHLIVANRKEIKEKYLPVLRKQYESAESTYEKILALKTIANSAIDISVTMLEKIIKDRKQPTIIRVEAVDALRIISNELPRKVYHMLMPIFKHRKEHTEVRAAALVRILYTIPPKHVLSQIVSVMETDPNQQVAKFTYTFLSSLGKSSFASEQEMIKDVAMLMKQSNFRPNGPAASFLVHFPFYFQKWFTGAHINIGSLVGKDSIFPKDIMIDLETMIVGRWSQYFSQVGLSHQNIEAILYKIYSKLISRQATTRGDRNPRVQEGISLVEEIAKKLNIRMRERSTEEPFAMLYFRYKQMDYAVVPINERYVDSFIEEYLEKGTLNTDLLEKMINLRYTVDTTHAGFLFEITHRHPTSFGVPLTFSAKMPSVFAAEGTVSMEKISYGVRLRAQAVPSVSTTQVYQLRMWIPLFEQGAKLVRPTKIVLPINLDLDVQVKDSIEIKIHINTPERKQTLISMTAQPVAFLRFPNPTDMNKFVEIEENTILVPGSEKRTRIYEKKIEIAGLVFNVIGHGYKQWTLKDVIYGEQSFMLTVERTRNTPKTIIYHGVIYTDKNANIEKPKTERLLKDELSLPEEQMENYREIIRNIKKGFAVKFVGSVETNEKSKIEMDVQCESSGTFCRVQSNVIVPMNSGRDWKWEQIIEAVVPRLVSNLDTLRQEKNLNAWIVSSSKWGSEKKNEIVVRMIVDQSPEMQKWIQRIPSDLKGIEEYDVLSKVAALNNFNAVAKYEISPDAEIYFDKFFDVIKAYGFWSSKTQMRKSRENHVYWDITVEPIARRVVNLTIQTPSLHFTEEIKFNNAIPLPSMIYHHENSITKNAQCEVSKKAINTFDGVSYKAPLTTCFSVIAKDCSEEARYAVLVKKASKRTERMIMKAVKGSNAYVAKLIDGEIEVRLNNRILENEDFTSSRSVERVNSKMIAIDLSTVVVRFDGYSVKVLSSGIQKSTQCGLCGHFDDDKTNIFRTADDQETEDIEEFHRSYLVNDEECSIEEEEITDKKNYKIYEDWVNKHDSYEENYDDRRPREDVYDDERTLKQYDEERKIKNRKDYPEYEDRESTEPIKKNLIREHSHRVCVSIEPLPECPSNATPLQKSEKKVKFACLPRHEPETRRILREIRENPVRLEHTVSLVDKIMLPVTCVVY